MTPDFKGIKLGPCDGRQIIEPEMILCLPNGPLEGLIIVLTFVAADSLMVCV